MAGRIAVRGPIRQTDGRAAGHVRIRLQTMARYAARNAVVRMLPVSPTLGPAARNVLRAALLRVETCGRAACGKLIWNARLPPRVSRLILTSPCSAVFSERFGRTPYFRHWPPCAAQPRKLWSAREGLPDKFFVPTFRYRRSRRDRTCLWAPSLPVAGSVRATRCISLSG